MCKCQSCNDKCQDKYIDAKCIKTKFLKAKKATICEDLNVKGDVTIDGDLTFKGCLTPIGKLDIPLSISAPEYVIPCDYSSTSSSWKIDIVPTEVSPIVEAPLDDLPEQTTAFKPTISICRGVEIIYLIDSCILGGESLENITNTGLIQGNLDLLAGDVVKLNAFFNAYSTFNIFGCFFDQDFLLRHTEEEEFTKKVTLNDLTVNYIMPSPKTQIGGWYESDTGALGSPLFWIEEKNDGYLQLNGFSSVFCGPFYVNRNFILPSNYSLTCLGDNKYSDDFDNIYTFDSNTGKFNIDLSDDTTLQNQVGNLQSFEILAPILNPSERLWQYEHRLTDESAKFNTFENFLDFAYNYYKTGKLSTWTSRSKQLEGSVNPSGKDLTQCKRTVGGVDVDTYEDLYTTLKQTGISYEYNVKKAVYWPYPGTVTDNALKESVRYPINQNRYNYLAFILDFPQLSETNWPKLLPGERVQLSGTGVARLEEQPLRLATSGYNAGPLPPNTHAPQYSIDNWSYYTFRLPIVINESNNIVRSQYVNTGLTETVIPVGTYYFGELIDFLVSQFPTDNAALITVGRYGPIAPNPFGEDIDQYFGEPGLTNALANRQALTIGCSTGEDFGDFTLYGPTHPDFPSTLFNTEGIDIGDKFPLNQEIVVVDDGNFDLVDVLVLPINEYKPHTPLTESELETLVNNMENITLSATHGPIRNNMTADNMTACVFELSQAHSTEDHQIIYPWSKKCEGGLDELFLEKDDLANRLNSIEKPNGQTFIPTVSDPFFQPTQGIRSIPLRVLGQGDFAERSELYRAGGRTFSRTIQNQERGYNVLTWQPQRRENFYYPTPTVLPGFGDVSGRETETVVSYLKEAFWMTVTAASPNDPPVYDMAAYETNSSAWTSMFDGSPAPANPDAVAGNWMVGIYEESVVQRAFEEAGEAVPNPLPVYGYLTHDTTQFSTTGDVEQLPWYDPDYELLNTFGSISAAVAMVSKIFQYFNTNGVSHFVMDQRTTIGGGAPVAQAISLLSGGDRTFVGIENTVDQKQPLTPNGVTNIYDRDDLFLQAENEGLLTYPVLGLSSVNDCKPSAYLANGVPADGFFQGTITNPKRIIWINPNSTISAGQADLITIKGSSLDQDNFDGELGNNTCVAVYGTYSLPFSTSGTYFNIYQWYGIPRSGEEEIQNPPMNGLDRVEGSRLGYTTSDNVLQAIDQSFNQLIRPHILWDMNSNVWFQDIGFVNGGTGVQPAVDGEPWVDQRPAVSSPVNYDDVSTWRDAAIDRSFIMANDPNLKDNFYAQNNYGFIADPSP